MSSLTERLETVPPSISYTISWHISPPKNTPQTGQSKNVHLQPHSPILFRQLHRLLEQCRVAGKRGARIIDLAAGTGKFTEALAAREEGFEILAVEPHADMRRVLSERGLKGVKVVDGTAENVPVENGWADAVFVAQVGFQSISFCSPYSHPLH
jgi:SAM-dependent methyltransferase